MDYFDILLAKKLSGGGGGDITVEGLNVEENGTYTAPSGKAYSPVVVNLPLDEKTITANGEYLASADDLKGFSKVTVNVAGFTKKAMPTGAISSFNDGTANPLTKLKIAINPVQAGSGDPSPSNPRPISGWTGANIHVADGETPHIIDNVVNIIWQTEAGTVYGGELDVTSGVLTINTLTKTIDGVNEQVGGVWGATTYGYAVYVNMPVNKTANTICDKFKYTNKGYINMELYTYVGGSGTQQTWTFILPNTVTSKAEANDWFSNNPTTLTYPLDSPTTVQLTPTQVKSLLGNNNIWADTGDILEGEYFVAL